MKQTFHFSVIALVFCLLMAGCGGDSGPALPQAATLVFPDNLSECTTGVDRGGNQSRITFEWLVANNTFDYQLVVENLSNASDRQTFTTQNTSQQVTLSQGEGYKWQVVSRNEEGTETANSEEWMFFNAGSVESFPPFPATLVAPLPGARLRSADGLDIPLQWTVSDLDGDIVQIEVFVSDDPDPASIAVLPAGTNSFTFTATPGIRYFWKVRATDQEGNRSDSSLQDFQVD